MTFFGPKRIGLVLGSGSARGFAHIGVLKVLEEEGLAPYAIAGTSMGALIGAFYAAGVPLAELEEIALDFDVRQVTSVGDVALGKGAVFSGEKVQAFLRQYLPATFEELAMPFGCVATDLTRNQPVRFTSGDLIAAVRASVSVPLAFLPVRMDDALLIDGYVTEPAPVRLARHLGGETIVAVDVSGDGTVGMPEGDASPSAAVRIWELRDTIRSGSAYRRGSGSLDVLGAVSEAFEGRLAAEALREADIVISPPVHHLTGMDFGQAAELIEAGEFATLVELDAIRRKSRRPAPSDA
ncbi:MAG: patatin-like phospholipase family protein [Coriobacteriia bacterium]|nr:patatin-like phospholipase family protein [Coriobacteriia bacterium]